MKITILGDIMCEPPVLKGAKQKDGSFDFSYVFKHALPLLSEAEEVITARFGDDVARLLLDEFPSRIVSGKRI